MSITISGLRWKLLILLVVLGLLIAVMYEFLAPGTWYQYQLCKRGSIKGHTATFSFTTHDIQVCIAPGYSNFHETSQYLSEIVREVSETQSFVFFGMIEVYGSLLSLHKKRTIVIYLVL